MKILILLLSVLSLPALELEFLGVDYKQQDKQQHFILGAAVSAVAMLIVDKVNPDAKWYTRAAIGTAAAAIVGAGKEWADSKDLENHVVETDDFVATLTGGLTVSLSLSWSF